MAIATAPALSEQTSNDFSQNSLMSFAEYIEHERASDVKHHYYYGRLIEVAGATYEHNYISGNLIIALGVALNDANCGVMPSDMKVFVSQDVAYYPDVVVICAEPLITSGEALQNPVLVAEILSPSTAALDRGEKFRQYRTISSLRHYLLLEQDRPIVEHFERDNAGIWALRGEYDALEQNLELTISDHAVSLPLSKIYRNITFPAVAPSSIVPSTTEE
jgi:Uma2 family endonuclease